MRIVASLTVTLALAGCAARHEDGVDDDRHVEKPQPSAAPGPQNAAYFGQPSRSAGSPDSGTLLVLKPQSYLVGITANTAFAQQQGKQCAPLSCPGVEDDRLVVPAGSQKLTFVLPATTRGTVLTINGGKMDTTESRRSNSLHSSPVRRRRTWSSRSSRGSGWRSTSTR